MPNDCNGNGSEAAWLGPDSKQKLYEVRMRKIYISTHVSMGAWSILPSASSARRITARSRTGRRRGAPDLAPRYGDPFPQPPAYQKKTRLATVEEAMTRKALCMRQFVLGCYTADLILPQYPEPTTRSIRERHHVRRANSRIVWIGRKKSHKFVRQFRRLSFPLLVRVCLALAQQPDST